MGALASKDLTVAQNSVKLLTSQLRQSAAALDTTRKELALVQQASSQADWIRARENAELTEARRRLEMISGELKAATAEQGAVERLRGELTDATKAAAAERREKEALNRSIIVAANLKLKPQEHPVFGALLHDDGFKRTYRASPLTVWAATPIWEKQRAFRHDRAESIAKAKALSKVSGWPGTIAICEIIDSTDPAAVAARADPAVSDSAEKMAASCFVIDGQHRLGAAHILAKQEGLGDALSSITVELYPKAVAKAVEHKFYLGLDSVWIVEGAAATDDAVDSND
ncbi:hypothetical protein T492DRAFT_982814 [Pavlovales sp. CCMP2436]|nr:hypothetical protein T492DRAFT_982814 [Pavlovales sp. CCMP2436]